ncbi:MAG TPA: hypothetical protein VGK32_11880 [Vicinamibacterales bacterium]|jgi:hypothetical protein
MKKVLWIALALVVAVGLLSVANAAEKSYQFTGTVKSVDGATFTVEKSAKDVWTFTTEAATKGAPKVGEKVTVYYKMIATEIEAKPAAAKPAAAKPAPKKK